MQDFKSPFKGKNNQMTKKRVFLFTLTLLLISQFTNSYAQYDKNRQSVGFSVGGANFLGDLGGANDIGRPFLKDLDIQATRPSISAFYRFGLNKWVSFKADLMYTQLVGNDKFTQGTDLNEDSFYRRYRNLNFRSNLFSFAVQGELNLYKYTLGNNQRNISPTSKSNQNQNNFAPYIGVGGGFFYFDPRSEDPLTGEMIRLQPLGTEGQGMPGYDKKYSLFQPQIVTTFGVRFNAGPFLAMSLEANYHHTFTDYIDDVSTVFANPADFAANYPAADAALRIRMADRSGELTNVPLGPQYDYITSSGQQRGDFNDRDHFFNVQASFIFILDSKKMRTMKYSCPVW
jgi:hypothetical protein